MTQRKQLTLDELNARLQATRDQKFRKRTQAQLDGDNSVSTRAQSRWQQQDFRDHMHDVYRSPDVQKKLRDASQIKYNNITPAKRELQTTRTRATKVDRGTILPAHTWQEIYEQLWGADRNTSALDERLCEQYGIKQSTLRSLKSGSTQLNLPADTLKTHSDRLRQWEEKYGRRRYQFVAQDPAGHEYTFGTQVELGAWAIERWKFADKPSTRGGSLCKNQRTRTKGILKGWTFIKRKIGKHNAYSPKRT